MRQGVGCPTPRDYYVTNFSIFTIASYDGAHTSGFPQKDPRVLCLSGGHCWWLLDEYLFDYLSLFALLNIAAAVATAAIDCTGFSALQPDFVRCDSYCNFATFACQGTLCMSFSSQPLVIHKLAIFPDWSGRVELTLLSRLLILLILA